MKRHFNIISIIDVRAESGMIFIIIIILQYSLNVVLWFNTQPY